MIVFSEGITELFNNIGRINYLIKAGYKSWRVIVAGGDWLHILNLNLSIFRV